MHMRMNAKMLVESSIALVKSRSPKVLVEVRKIFLFETCWV